MLVDLGRNDLSRVCKPGTVKVERFLEPERFSHVTHLVSEVAGELREASRRSTCCARPSRRERSPARRRCARCRSSPSSRATGGARTRASSATTFPAWRSTRASRSAPSSSTRHGVPAGGAGLVADSDPSRRARGVPEQARGARDGDRAGRGDDDDPADRQLRLVHLQPRPPVRGARCGADRAPQRRDHARRGGGARAVAPRRSRPARAAGGRGRDASRSSSGSPARCRRSASASATRRSSRRSAARSAWRSELSTARRRSSARREGALHRHAARTSSPGATTRSPRRRVPDVFEVTATAADGEVMAVRHRELPVDGVQFHPGVGADAARARRSPGTSSRARVIQQRARAAARRPRPLARGGARR